MVVMSTVVDTQRVQCCDLRVKKVEISGSFGGALSMSDYS